MRVLQKTNVLDELAIEPETSDPSPTKLSLYLPAKALFPSPVSNAGMDLSFHIVQRY